MTLWKRIIQGITALMTGTGIGMITGVVSAALTFRYLTPDAYGRLTLFLSFYQTGNAFLSLGVNGVVTTEIARARGNKEWGWLRYLTGWYSLFIIATGLILFIVFWGIGNFSENIILWHTMGAFLLLSAPNNIATLLFHSATRFRRMASLTISRSFSRVILLATLPWWSSGSRLTGVALTYPLLELVTLITAVFLLRKVYVEFKQTDHTGHTHNFQQIRQLINTQAGYAILSVPLKNMADQLPIWFLQLILGETAVGLYSAAKKTFSFVLSAIRSIEITLFPLVAEQMVLAPERLKVALRQSQKYTFWLGLAVVLAGSLLAPWLLTLIAQETYQDSTPLFRIIIWHLPIYAFAQTQRPLLFASGAQKWLFTSYVMGSIIALISLPLAILGIGVYGAALGFLIYNGAVIGIRQQMIHRITPEFWISPLTVFRIESFDYRLWQTVKNQILGLIHK